MSRQARRVPLDYEHPKNEQGHYVPLFESDDDERPPEERMPRPDPEAELGWCMYETCSEGTPISPVFRSEIDLARWLADNRTPAFADLTASYEDWLRAIKRGNSVTAVIIRGQKPMSGVTQP